MTHEIIFITLRLLFSPSEYVRLKSPCNYCLRQFEDHERGPNQTEIIRDDSKCLSSECYEKNKTSESPRLDSKV